MPSRVFAWVAGVNAAPPSDAMDNKQHRAKWTDQDFGSLSWHDNCVHAIRVRNPEDGYDFDLVLDIDHILDWIKTPDTNLEFIVAPATLIFHGVAKLMLDIRLARKEGMVINEIQRTEVSEGSEGEVGPRRYVWHIDMQSFTERKNSISFEAQAFTQELTEEPVGPIARLSLMR